MNLIIFCAIFYLIQKIIANDIAPENEINTDTNTSSSKERTKRFLIVPPTAPTRHQLIWGIGIPLGLESESVTSGWVIKAQYFMLTSVNDLKPSWIFGTGRHRGERSLDDIDRIGNETYYVDPMTGVKTEHYNESVKIIETKPIIMEDHDETEINYDEDIVWRENYKNDDQIKMKNSRWMIYRLIEGIAENKGLDGRACLLRTICEAADAKFSHKSGLMGELLHVILTPSTTREPASKHSDNEYFAAEQLGKDTSSCEQIFPECEMSLLDIFTGVIDPAEELFKLMN